MAISTLWRAELGTARQPHDACRTARLEPAASCTVMISAPNARACVVGAARQFGPADSRGKSQIVLDAGALAGLAAGCFALDQHGPQAFGRAVHGRGQAGGSCRRRQSGRRTAARRASAGRSGSPAGRCLAPRARCPEVVTTTGRRSGVGVICEAARSSRASSSSRHPATERGRDCGQQVLDFVRACRPAMPDQTHAFEWRL